MVSEHVHAFDQREDAADTAYSHVPRPACHDQDGDQTILGEGTRTTTHSFVYVIDYSFTCLLAYLLTYPPTHIIIYIYTLTHQLTNSLTYLFSYFHSFYSLTYSLLKIYNIPVVDVATQLFLGKWGRFYGKKRIISYKKRNFKKSIVAFDPNGVIGQVSKRLGYKGVGRLPTK